MFQLLSFACRQSPNAAAAQDSPLVSPLTCMVAAHLEQTQGTVVGGDPELFACIGKHCYDATQRAHHQEHPHCSD